MRLVNGDLIERGGAEDPLPHSYSVAVESGLVARLVLDQRECDLFVEVTGANGSATRYDSFPRGYEFITLFSTTARVFELRLDSCDSAKRTTAYSLHVTITVRRDVDDSRMVAEQEATVGKQLQAVRDATAQQQALEYLLRALQGWRLAREHWGEAAMIHQMANIHYFQGRLEEASTRFSEAERLLSGLGDRRGAIEANNGLGVSYWQLGRIESARKVLLHTLDEWRSLQHSRGEAATTSNLGILSYEVGEWQVALDHFAQARAIALAIGDKAGEGYASNNLAAVYKAIGQPHRAKECLKEAIEAFQSCDNAPAAARCLLLLGQLSLVLGNVQEAESIGQGALRQLIEFGDLRSQADALRLLAEVFQRRGEDSNSFERYHGALEIYRRIGNRQGEAATWHGIGLLHLGAGAIARALPAFGRARRIRRSLDAAEGEAETLFAIGRAAAAHGRGATAIFYLEKAIGITEELRSRIPGLGFRTSYFSPKHDYYAFLIHLLMTVGHRLGPASLPAAFHASERSRARSFLDLLRRIGTLAKWDAPSHLIEAQQQLDKEIQLWSHRWSTALSAGDGQAASRARARLTGVLEENRELDSRLHASAPRAWASANPPVLSLPEVQRDILDEDSTLLHYALTDGGCYLWAITASACQTFQLGPSAAIVNAARRLYDLTANSGSTSRTAAVAAAHHDAVTLLSNLLLPAQAFQSGSRRYIFAVEGILQYVPYAALLTPAGRRPLVWDYEVITVPSISVLAELRASMRSRPAPARQLAVIADPVFDSVDSRVSKPTWPLEASRELEGVCDTLPRLSFSRMEAQSISSLLPSDECSVSLDFAANREALLSQTLSSCRIVHFASHALIDDASPELSSLVVSLVLPDGTPQNGLISLRDILSLELSADLVILSACRSGLGEDVQGEGIVGMTRAFMSAGARGVLVTLWKVDDEATYILMKHFYQGLLGPERLPPTAALRAAQVKMMSDDRFGTAFYWAGFILQGDWTER